MTTLLVANRGEIALRVFRTARRMGLRTVAVYSEADAGAPHVRAADVGVAIGPAPATESYLRGDRILDAARQTNAELIHPGYGFLAEDHRFAKDCETAGVRFVGPPADVLLSVGDKARARALAVAAGVPVLDAYAGDDQRDEAFLDAAAAIGFPLLVKPSAGGGGKGMTVVSRIDDLPGALASARRLALAAFDDDRVILERYLEGPRHLEVQVLADTQGRVVHLGERDCSLQRRHQKILEESPAPNLDADRRRELHDAAIGFARHAGYVGAGTCEFLVGADGGIGFIEMNARLQVEHPVTEMVTGLDLVELQLRVAMGEPLPLEQPEVQPNGHAVEVRVYAEAPDEGFLPQAGRVEHVRWPEGVRVDTGIEEGTDVSPHYDPLVAKLVAHGRDRAEALGTLQEALAGTELLGLKSNLAFLDAVSRDPIVAGGLVTTDWLETAYAGWTSPVSEEAREMAVAVAAAAETRALTAAAAGTDPWSGLGPWRAGGGGGTYVVLRIEGEERALEVGGDDPFLVDERWEVVPGPGCHEWRELRTQTPAAAARGADRWYVWVAGAPYEVLVGPAARRPAGAGPARLDSPLPGRVIAVRVGPGQRVAEGEELVVVEAMKMEHAIRSPASGTVRAVLCSAGEQVERGQPLVDFDPA